MKSRIQTLLALVALVGVVCTAVAGDILASFPETVNVLARVDMQKLKQVPVIDRALADQLGPVNNFIEQLRNWIGLDLNTVTALWIGVEKKDHAVFVMQGEFDAGQITGGLHNMEAAQIIPKDNVPVAALLPDEKKPGQFNLGAVLDAQTIAIGQPNLAERFVDAYSGAGKGLDATKLQQVQALRESKSLVHAFILGVDPADMQKNPWMHLLSMGELIADVDTDLLIDLGVGVRNPQLVEPMRQTLDGLLAIYKSLEGAHKKGDRIQQLLFENATVAVADNRVRIRSKLAEQVMNDLVTAKLAGPKQQ